MLLSEALQPTRTAGADSVVLSEIAFHEKAGRSQVGSFVFSLDKLFSPAESPVSPPFHPHSFSERLVRSVQVGRSRFSRCCHLLVDLPFILKDERWARRLTQSPELGALGFLLFLSKNVFDLCGGRHCSLVAVAQRFVGFSAHPQAMQQHR